MCRLAPSIARRSMGARSRATPTIQSCGRSRPTPAMPTRRGLGDEGECESTSKTRQGAPLKLPRHAPESASFVQSRFLYNRLRIDAFREPDLNQNDSE